MRIAIWILSILLYIALFSFVYKKQKECGIYNNQADNEVCAAFLAAIAPITIIIYSIKAVFFEEWI